MTSRSSRIREVWDAAYVTRLGRRLPVVIVCVALGVPLVYAGELLVGAKAAATSGMALLVLCLALGATTAYLGRPRWMIPPPYREDAAPRG